ncbi:HNH endonuclease [Candidatus Spongiihabitans sp.]|uniref:HNH endonuclease n=1 Tax=Candidatus Spongiihabitans sp. TaxID=3101308 RepID=UPI003C6F1C4E
MLYFNKRETRSFCDIKSVNIDQFYFQNIGFEYSSEAAQRFEKILDMLGKIFSDHKPLKAHYAISLVLLVDGLLRDYVPGWEEKLHNAFMDFNKKYLAAAKAMKGDHQTDENKEYYNSYVQSTSTKIDVADTIQRRHQFFVKEMLRLLNPTSKDPKRNFTDTEKEYIYYKDKRMCQVCKMRDDSVVVPWNDAEFHHVQEHHQGGKSVLSNGALVHKGCHPRSKENVDKFCCWWESGKNENMDEQKENLKFPPSEGTECRFKYQDKTYYGKIEKKRLVIDAHGDYGSFSMAS